MSVVNKMLKDLEARKSQPDEINADYQPPQKGQSKWLVYLLLVLAIAAITFGLIDTKQIFSSEVNSTNTTAKITSAAPKNVAKKMMVLPDQTKQTQVSQSEQLISPAQPTNNSSEHKPAPLTAEIANNPVANESENSPVLVSQIKPPIKENVQVETQAVKIEHQPITAVASQPSFSMSGTPPERQATNLKQRIAESLNNNDLDLAQTLLNKLVSEEPNNLQARKKLSSIYFAQGNYAQAKQLLTRGIAQFPQQTDLRLMLARLYAVQDEIPKALEVMTGVEPGINNQTEYLSYRAALAQQLKQTQVSKEDYLSLTGVDANNAKWWLGLAIAEDQLGDSKQALKAYNKAYSLGQLDDSVDDFIRQRISVLAGIQ